VIFKVRRRRGVGIRRGFGIGIKRGDLRKECLRRDRGTVEKGAGLRGLMESQ
jgi:hypothetical protein